EFGDLRSSAVRHELCSRVYCAAKLKLGLANEGAEVAGTPITNDLSEWLCDLFSPDDLTDFRIAVRARHNAQFWNFLTDNTYLASFPYFCFLPCLFSGPTTRCLHTDKTGSTSTSGQLLPCTTVIGGFISNSTATVGDLDGKSQDW
ncbi:hypothetical protein B0H14DRAFT_3165276, partial [Mycena olivaceomarginata]